MWHFRKKLQNLRPEATKVTILRLRHHHDGQVDIYIDPTLRISDTFFESTVVVHFLPGFLWFLESKKSPWNHYFITYNMLIPFNFFQCISSSSCRSSLPESFWNKYFCISCKTTLNRYCGFIKIIIRKIQTIT